MIAGPRRCVMTKIVQLSLVHADQGGLVYPRYVSVFGALVRAEAYSPSTEKCAR